MAAIKIEALKEIVDQACIENPGLDVKMSVNGEYLVRVHSAEVWTEHETGEKYFLMHDW